jgi:hypothetical protein
MFSPLESVHFLVILKVPDTVGLVEVSVPYSVNFPSGLITSFTPREPTP